MKKELNKLIVRDNCHPAKASVVVWFQIPAWILLSYSLRNMTFMYPVADEKATLIHTQLSNEGILWFSNLTIPDPLLLLPFLAAGINLTIVEVYLN